SGVKTAFWASGKRAPNRVGPNSTPATISPSTRGCFTHRASRPQTADAARMVTMAGRTRRTSSRFGPVVAARGEVGGTAGSCRRQCGTGRGGGAGGRGPSASGAVGDRAPAGRMLLEVAARQALPAGVQHHDGAQHQLPQPSCDVLHAVAHP